jgi:hypothetical protein
MLPVGEYEAISVWGDGPDVMITFTDKQGKKTFFDLTTNQAEKLTVQLVRAVATNMRLDGSLEEMERKERECS